MRILQIDTGREMRGGQWQVLRLMQGLAEEGVETWLAARPESPLFAKVAGLGLRAEPLSLSSLRRRADLVHAHDARAHALAVALARTPVIVSRRVAFPIGTGLASRWKYKRAAHFIAVSEFVRRGMVERGIPPVDISVVYDGVPLLPVTVGGTRILAPPPSADKPEEFYNGLGREVAFAKNLEDDLKTALLFVYLSKAEGLGSAVLLAMAAGVPVVAARIGGIPEIVRDEENGLLVDMNDRMKHVTWAVNRLRGEPDLARRLGVCGRETVAEKFSVDHMVRNTLAVYHRMLTC
jgi:glycosyltransferase involved in cell wall biosynthesis